jgi:hypothetical protein
MKDSKNCDCGICSKCNELDRSDTVVDESGFMIVQILDPDKEKMLKGLAEILPPMDVKEIILASLQDLKISSGIIKVAAKHKPNNPKLWSKCIAEAKRKFDVFPCVPVDCSYALSEVGWKSYSELKIGDKIISYNKEKNQLEWDIIKNIHFYKSADTIRMYKANTCFDFLSTKDHKWVLKNKKPLPGIKSVRADFFYINLPPNNQTLAATLEEMGAKKIQETYLFANEAYDD